MTENEAIRKIYKDYPFYTAISIISMFNRGKVSFHSCPDDTCYRCIYEGYMRSINPETFFIIHLR